LNPDHPYSVGLECLYLMNEGSGLSLEDLVAGNTGTIAGSVTWDSDEYGPHLVFAATTDCPKIPHTAALNFDGFTGSYSFIIGVKADAQANSYRLTEKGDSFTAYPISIQGAAGAQPNAYIYDKTLLPGVSLGTVLDGTWRIIVFVVDHEADYLYGYNNGVFIASTVNTVTATTANSGRFFLGNNYTYTRDFIGRFGFFMAYSYALSAAQAAELSADPFCMVGLPPAAAHSFGSRRRKRRRSGDFCVDRIRTPLVY